MLLVFETKKDAHIEEARELLKEAEKQGYEFVIILGCKDDRVKVSSSAALDCVKKLGMIEAAKLDFWKEWK